MYLIDSRVAKRLAKSWQGGSGHGSGAEVVEAKEEDEEEEEKKEKEKEDNKIGVAEKSFHYCHDLVQVCYCYSRACKGTLCGPVFFNFLIRV